MYGGKFSLFFVVGLAVMKFPPMKINDYTVTQYLARMEVEAWPKHHGSMGRLFSVLSSIMIATAVQTKVSSTLVV